MTLRRALVKLGLYGVLLALLYVAQVLANQ